MSSTIRYNGQPGTSDAALYTSSGQTTIRRIVAYNGTGAAHTVTLKVVRAISGNTEQLCSALALPAGSSAESEIFDPRLSTYNEIVLENGDSLHGSADAATAVNVLAF